MRSENEKAPRIREDPRGRSHPFRGRLTEREGFEPPSPFGRSLSRRVQYHSASAPTSKQQSPSHRRHCRDNPGSLSRGARMDLAALGRLRRSAAPARTSGPHPGDHPVGPASRDLNRGARMDLAALGRLRRSAAPARTSGPHPGDHPVGPASRDLNRGARIRTGDLCDPNAALYRTEPRPGPTILPTDSGVGVSSTTDGVGWTSLRSVASLRSARAHSAIFFEDLVGSNCHLSCQKTDGVGFEPTRA